MGEIVLQNKNGKILASSREVAERFGKEHSKVKRSIQALEKDVANFGEMFTLSYYEDSYGRKQEEYCMNRDGFSLIVMGFTGKKALEWKLKYIEAFNKMEDALRSQSNKALPTTYKEALLQLLEEVEKNEKLEEERKILLPKAGYHDEVLNKDGLLTTTVIAKDLGLRSAAKLNQVMFQNRIIFKSQSGQWLPYADYEWLIKEKYADYQSYESEHTLPCLKWTEKGRKWIIENYEQWVDNLPD